MGATSWQVKKRYNAKTYKNFTASLKIAEFEEIEEYRNKEGLSRSELIRRLWERFKEDEIKQG